MNKVYKTIWNDAIKSWVAVPEIMQSGPKLKNSTDNKINPKNKCNSKKENILRIFNIKNIVIVLSGLFPLIANAVVSDKLTVIVDDDEKMVAVYNIDIYKKYFPTAKWNSNSPSNLYLPETIVVGKNSSLANSATDSKTDATGGSVIFGPNSVAYGFGNTAFGAGTYVSTGGTALGVATIANNLSTSVGRSAVAENNGVAIGRAALASDTADGGVAIGVSSKATANNAVAIGRSSVASNVNEVSFGNDTIKRKLTNIDAGSADNDAVNFKQLSTTNANVAKNTQELIDTNNVLNTAKTDLTKQISDNKTDANNQITTVNNKITQINNGEIGLVKINSANNLINVASDKLGKIVSFTGLNGNRKLTGIDKGTENNDAVNVSQLNETNALVAKNTTDIADNKTVIDKNTTDIAGNKTAIDKNTTDIADNKTAIDKNTTDIADNKTAIDKNTTDIADNKTAINKNTTDIADNKTAIDKNTTDIADNKTAIDKNTTDIADNKTAIDKNTSDITSNTAAIDKNTQDISKQGDALKDISTNLESGTLGLVQLSANGEEVILSDKAKDAKAFNIGNKTLNGVLAGKLSTDSTEAVNGSQLHATNQAVTANTTAIADNKTAIDKNTTDIADNKTAIDKNTTDIADNKTAIDKNTSDITSNTAAIDKNTQDISKQGDALKDISTNLESGTLGLVQLSANGEEVILSDKAKDANAFNIGNKTLNGVLAGKLSADSTEAVNGSQLHATNQAVTANTTAIADNKTAIDKNTNDIKKNTADISKQGETLKDISSNLESGTLGLVQLSANGEEVILSEKAKDAKAFNIGNKTLNGVKAGKLSADSTEAVNGSQLYATNQTVKTNTDNITKNTNAISQNTQDIVENKNAITTITKNIDSGSLGLVQLSADNQKIVLNSKADSARVFEFNNRTLSGVSAGRVAADSTEAVNGSQLHTTNQSVAKNTQKIQENSDKIAQHDTAIAQNTKDIQANTDKLTQHDKMLNQNSQDIKENTNRLNEHDKEIAQSKQDIKANTEKLAEHDSAISKNTSDIQKNTAALDKQGSEIARLSSEMGDAGALKMSRDGESINLSDKAKSVKSINFGDKQLSGIADAKNDSDAVNLAQMKRGNAETLKSANTYTDERVNQLGEFTENGLNRLNTKIDDLDKKVDKGFAANAALSGLFQPYGVGKMNLTAGVGGYKDESAVAVGMGYRINENVAIKGGVAASTGTGSSTMYNASVNFEW
ncbi:YadA-like family protein [Providencia rettgeri]|nr:YadA-like family protein [Providencia rettgeri]QLR04477.1 YadA-like family protein [Providencia rettgeri]